eukprot:scaffold25932_cov107-Isochrysis_galbana.AAC.6
MSILGSTTCTAPCLRPARATRPPRPMRRSWARCTGRPARAPSRTAAPPRRPCAADRCRQSGRIACSGALVDTEAAIVLAETGAGPSGIVRPLKQHLRGGHQRPLQEDVHYGPRQTAIDAVEQRPQTHTQGAVA